MAEAFRQVFKAEGSLGQSMMFQPTAVTAARAKEAPSENAAADRGRRNFMRSEDLCEEDEERTVPPRRAGKFAGSPAPQLGAASAAALMRERALTLEREEEEVRKNMREVTLEVDLTQPLGILFNKFLEADQVNGGSQSARLGVQPGWRAVSLAGEKFKETRELVAKIQALKEEGTTAVSAVFLVPPLAEPKEAEPPSVEEVKPKAMEADPFSADPKILSGHGVPRKRVAAEDRSTARSDAIHVEDVRCWRRRDRRRCRDNLRRTIRDVQGGSSSSLSGLSLAGLAAVAVAAVPSRTAPAARSTAVRAYDASKEIGACDPLLFWDPIGYCGGDCTKEDFDRRRAVELKHGRICMFATIGMVWPDLFGKFDGYLSPSANLKFADVPSGIAAISKVPLEGWLQILLVAGLIETQLFKDQSFGGFGYAKYGEPGNFGTGYWGRKIQDPAERKLKLTTELNNGRLAMVTMTAMLIQNGLTGQSTIEQLTSGHFSPFNDGQGFFAQFDPSKELGACPPLGYWDPFGMMAFQDEEKFRNLVWQ
ncbi:unnamed protein product, partial [Cladocopium goreaui]